MRRGRRGRPHLLCPPCPPIGRSGGQGAETSAGAETSSGAERGFSHLGKAARALRGRCAGPRSSSGCQAPARRCHGRPAPALRALSGTKELGHRSAKGARSQDRCRQAVLSHGSRHSAKPVSSVRLRGVSTVQCNRICVPSICFNQSNREPKQRRRHCVAHLLGGVWTVRAGRVLQRSTPVLVPFVLRGQVRLPVVLHGSRALERGSHAVSSRDTAAVSKAPRGRGQRRERPRRESPGRGSGNNPGRPSERDPAPEGQVKPSSSRYADLPPGELGGTSHPKPSTNSSTDASGEPPASPASPSKPLPGSASQTTSGQSPPDPPAGGSRLPSKSQNRLRLRARVSPSGRPRPQSSVTSSGQPQPAPQPAGPKQRTSTSPSRGPPVAQPPEKTSDGPGEPAPQASKGSPPPTSSTSAPQLPAPGLCGSSAEYTSESTTEVTCSWPHLRHGLRCLQHCWRLKHLAC
ncbi:serine/arginine repetitive matrix protein 1-like isoform X1 [Panthera uncia]|uniref:serine/arginine repetitive matrix protein 1-like isoform X1 n=1 Tax=Panthera uncia TaxID=29064 RepID=UPI0020FF8F31|nr:serine/arginine repetitive matrix protein 1-like isoform X1 [Panthera uncia]